MKKRKGIYQMLNGFLATAMVAANLSASLFSTTALAASEYVDSGPGAVEKAAAGGTADGAAAGAAGAATGTLPADSPYKEVTVAVRSDGWLDIGNYSSLDIRGVSFEIGCKIDWDGGGGGGIYIDNWDKVPQFSYTTMKDRITYLFQPDEIQRLRQNIKLNIWWTWADGEGKTHVDDVFFKENSVRLLVDKDAQPVTRPTAAVGGGSGGSGGGGGGGGGGGSTSGGGSSSGGGNGSTQAGSSAKDYPYIVREKGVVKKIQVKDICPEYELGDIVRLTMNTKGGTEWNNFDLYCAEEGENKKVSKPGGEKKTSITLEAKPDNGTVFVQINWLGGDYMMFGIQAQVIGHGEPVEDVIIRQFTQEEYEAGKGEYFFEIPVSIAEAMEQIGAEFGRDEVIIQVGLESDGWWNGVLGASTPDGWSQQEYYGGFESSATFTGVPTADNFKVNVGTMNGTYGVIKNLKVTKTGKQVEPDVINASFTKEEYEAGKGEYFYEVPISIADQMQEIGAEFGKDEVKITVSLESDDWWNGVAGMSGPDGWEQVEYYTGFESTAVITLVPAMDNFKVNVGTMNGTYGKVKNLKVEKTGKTITPETNLAVITREEYEAGKGEWFYEVPIPVEEQMREIGAEFGTDEVKITVTLESDDWWNGVVGMTGVAGLEGASGWQQVEYYSGFENTAAITLVPTEDDFKVNIGTLNGSYAKIKSVSVQKTGRQISSDEDVMTLTLADFEDAAKEGYDYIFDLTEELNAALAESGINPDEDLVDITAEVVIDGSWTYNKLELVTDAGTKESGNIEPAGSRLEKTVSIRGASVAEATLQWRFMKNEDYPDIEDGISAILRTLTVEKSEGGEIEDGPLLTVKNEELTEDMKTEGENAHWEVDLQELLEEYLADEDDISLGTDKIKVTLKLETDGGLYAMFGANAIEEEGWWTASRTVEGSGTYSLKGTITGNLQLQIWWFGGTYFDITGISVEKIGGEAGNLLLDAPVAIISNEIVQEVPGDGTEEKADTVAEEPDEDGEEDAEEDEADESNTPSEDVDADETREPSGDESADETGEPSEDVEADETGEPSGDEIADGTGEPSEDAETDATGKPSGDESADETGESSESEDADEIGEPSESEGADAAGTPSEKEDTAAASTPSEEEDANATGEPSEKEDTAAADTPSEEDGDKASGAADQQDVRKDEKEEG